MLNSFPLWECRLLPPGQVQHLIMPEADPPLADKINEL